MVAGAVVLLAEAAAFWSAGAVVAGAVVLLEAAAFWSVELGALGVCAGGFTGALALSEEAPAGALVVAAGALALFVSVVGVAELALVLWFAALAEDVALWSVAAGAVLEAGAVLDAVELASEEGAAPVLAWLLVQESEIMLTELTCTEPSLARAPWICT